MMVTCFSQDYINLRWRFSDTARAYRDRHFGICRVNTPGVSLDATICCVLTSFPDYETFTPWRSAYALSEVRTLG